MPRRRPANEAVLLLVAVVDVVNVRRIRCSASLLHAFRTAQSIWDEYLGN